MLESPKREKSPEEHMLTICKDAINDENTFIAQLNSGIAKIKGATKGSSVLPFLDPYESISANRVNLFITSNISPTDIEQMFREGKVEEAILAICNGIDTVIQSTKNSFIGTVDQRREFEEHYHESTITKDVSSLTALPILQAPKYYDFLGGLLMYATKYNKDPANTQKISANTIAKIEKSFREAKIFNTTLEQAIRSSEQKRFEQFFGNNQEIIEIFLDCGLTVNNLPNEKEREKIGKDIIKVLRSKPPKPEDIKKNIGSMPML